MKSRLHQSVALAVTAVLATSASAAEQAPPRTCYQDSSGRILDRRLPGTREVPCPVQGTPRRTEPAPAPVPVPGAPTAPGETPGAAPQVVAPPAPTAADYTPVVVSPIPRPAIEDYVDAVPVPDRWRIVDALGYRENRWDPYNRNMLKGDRPVRGDWFFNLALTSDTVAEVRQVAEPTGPSSSGSAGANDAFGDDEQLALAENLVAEFVYYKGNTVFKPPEWEFRLTPVLNVNYTRVSELRGIHADPDKGRTRRDLHLGLQAAFADRHLRDVSANYDFDSLRVGIQPFSADFRGFLFQDNQLGIRLFGTRASNRYQYNLAYFRRMEKDTNSGLNDLGASLRHDDVLAANLYRQDTFVPGFTAQLTLLYNRNTEDHGVHYDSNGFIQRPASLGREVPRSYDVLYAGFNGDGHFGRWNLTTSLYAAAGREQPGVFVDAPSDIRAGFAAAELSMDFDWLRPRFSLLYASGDKDPFDDVSGGFDAVLENPQFAGADTSYWIRQAIPLIGGGGVALSGRNGVLPSLRPSRDEGQSNFVNPGLMLLGAGLDADLLPELRLSLNLNTLYFADTASIEAARAQNGVHRHVGYDVSASLTWRPLMSQNIVLRASAATLLQGKGLDDLYPNRNPRYLLLNAVFSY